MLGFTNAGAASSGPPRDFTAADDAPVHESSNFFAQPRDGTALFAHYRTVPLDITMKSYFGPESGRTKTDQAVKLLNEIANSDGFRALVIGYSRYRHHDKLRPQEIYNRLMTGDRRGRGNLEYSRILAFDYRIVPGGAGSVIGYRNADTNDIFTYQDRFVELDTNGLVSHLGHEVVGHLAGNFGHPTYNVRGRGRSVPYKVDEFIDQLLEEWPGAG